jgi:hypothetical protein
MGIRRAQTNPDGTSPTIKDRDSCQVIRAREVLLAGLKETPGSILTMQAPYPRAAVRCAQPIQRYLNLIGTGTARASCSARAKSPEVPFHMAAILLLDLAFF